MKVLKIAAIVVGGVALAATGIGLAAGAGSLAAAFGYGLGAIGLGGLVGAVGLGTLGTIALGALAIDLSMIAGALAPKPSTGGNQTKWKADPYAGIPYVMGRTLVGGNIVMKRGHGSNYKYLTAVTVLGLGPFSSIDATYMDKAAVAFNGAGAATGTYAGQIWQRTQLGACPEASALSSPIGNPPGWTAAHKLSGLAAAIDSYLYDAKSENGLTSVPPPSWIVKGALVYDPRLDSTYPGGSGPCRAWDESTYVWSEDPHLHGLTWALGRFQNGVRVAGIGVGSGVPGGAVKGVDVARFVEGANLNDARGWKLGGQVYTRPDTPWNSLKAMLQAGGARPVLVGGVISCINSAPKVSLATIGRDDIAGACEFTGTQRKRSRINGIIAQYRSEQHDWEMVSAKRVSVAAFEALDGDERTRELSWPLVQQVNQVSQLAALTIYDLREAGPGTVPLKPAWLNYRIGDCVTFAPEDGFALKCQITGRGLDAQTATVTFTLRGETDGKHDYALGLTGEAPPIASLGYDESVAAPDSDDWVLAGETLVANGASIPALVLTGTVGNEAADAALFEFRPYLVGQADNVGWAGAAVEAAAITRKEFTGVTPATAYEVAVRYRARGRTSPRRIFGPVTSGAFEPAGYVTGLISTSFVTDADPADGLIQGTDTSLIVEDHVRTYDDKAVSVTGGTLTVEDDGSTALVASTNYHIYYDDPAREGGAVTLKVTRTPTTAATTPANPFRHYVGSLTTDVAGGTGTSGGGAAPPGWDARRFTDTYEP